MRIAALVILLLAAVALVPESGMAQFETPCAPGPCANGGICSVDVPTAPAICAGFGAIQCGGENICIDDPFDSCNIFTGGTDCSGLCVYEVCDCTGTDFFGPTCEDGVPVPAQSRPWIGVLAMLLVAGLALRAVRPKPDTAHPAE